MNPRRVDLNTNKKYNMVGRNLLREHNFELKKYEFWYNSKREKYRDRSKLKLRSKYQHYNYIWKYW